MLFLNGEAVYIIPGIQNMKYGILEHLIFKWSSEQCDMCSQRQQP